MNKVFVPIGLFGVCFLICACSTKTDDDAVIEPISEVVETTDAEAEPVSVEDSLQYGNMTVFSQFLSDDSSSERTNVLYSPYSVKSSFSVIYKGASDWAKDEIDSTLGFNEGTITAVEDYENILSGSDIGVKSANRVYLNSAYSINTDSLRDVGSVVKSFATEQDLENVVDDANSFVKDATNAKIKEVLHIWDIDRDTKMIAVNALYFNKNWKFKDDKNVYGDKSIYWPDDEQSYKAVAILDDSGSWTDFVKTDEDANIDITKLQYECKEDEPQYSMYLFTDTYNADGSNVKDYMISLTDEKLNELTNFEGYSGKEYKEVNIKFPKFEFEDNVELESYLHAAGMREVFSPYSSGFDAISQNMSVNNVLQSTYIKVNEAGTEAAAATAVTMQDNALMAEPDEQSIKNVFADSPFAYIIKDDTNDIVLFMGFVNSIEPIGNLYVGE